LAGASWVADFSDDEEQMMDGDGHGTHVAGTIGSATWGVAKKTELLAIRVLDRYGSGTTSGVVAGIGQVAIDAASRKAAGGCSKGVVSNMSLGGYFTKAVNDAVSNDINLHNNHLPLYRLLH
jgi:subtilisin family serine protease